MFSKDLEEKIRSALHSIIDGKDVKRIKHELMYEDRDVSQIFIEELHRSGYVPTTVEQVKAQPGERVPAFFIQDSTAYFGWVFWEQFTSWKLRKLWGSVLKNAKGDWEIQIPASKQTTIYANESLNIEMDIDRPSEF